MTDGLQSFPVKTWISLWFAFICARSVGSFGSLQPNGTAKRTGPPALIFSVPCCTFLPMISAPSSSDSTDTASATSGMPRSSASIAPTCPVAPSLDSAPVKTMSYDLRLTKSASTRAVPSVSRPAKLRSLRRYASSAPRARHFFKDVAAPSGPIV